MKIKLFYLLLIPAIGALVYYAGSNINTNPAHEVGDVLDSLDGVLVYYNGAVNNVEDRNVSADGYNIGLRYQCVEFVKRYYYEHYDHKMPDSYGHAVDFFDKGLADGKINKRRNLIQYHNPGGSKPLKGDLLIMDGHALNPYGHVAIVSEVTQDEIEIIQQNPGPFALPRVRYSISKSGEKWKIDREDVLGWLRKQ